jgi:hypothetical protein
MHLGNMGDVACSKAWMTGYVSQSVWNGTFGFDDSGSVMGIERTDEFG